MLHKVLLEGTVLDDILLHLMGVVQDRKREGEAQCSAAQGGNYYCECPARPSKHSQRRWGWRECELSVNLLLSMSAAVEQCSAQAGASELFLY